VKEIKVIISDEVFEEIKTTHTIKSMMGNLFGIEDEFINKIIDALDDNKDEVVFKFKNEDTSETK